MRIWDFNADSMVSVGNGNVETAKSDGEGNEHAFKHIVRALLKNEDDGFRYTPAHAVAKAICGIGPSFSDEVKHYLSADAALSKWRDSIGKDFRQIAIGGTHAVFGVGDKPNRYFGVPDDMVVPQLASDIVSGCNTYLRFFDTHNGLPKMRGEMPVAVKVDPNDKVYGVAWSKIRWHEAYGGNYTRSVYLIEAFEHGREFLLSLVHWLYTDRAWATDIGAKIDTCHDWTSEIFGELNCGAVENLKIGATK